MVYQRTREVRMVLVPNHTASTLISIIKKHVAPGTLTMSDEWRTYNALPQHGYRHQNVNHSVNFVDPNNAASTQMIERQWREAKLELLKLGPGISPNTINSSLSNFWWRSLNGATVCEDPFLRFVDLIAKYARL